MYLDFDILSYWLFCNIFPNTRTAAAVQPEGGEVAQTDHVAAGKGARAGAGDEADRTMRLREVFQK